MRLLVHSILGATLFALLCAKILAVRVIATNDKMLPIIGMALFANYLLIWFVTVADYVTSANVNPPPSAALQVWVWVLSSIAGVLGGIGIFAFLRSRTGATKPKQSAPAAIAE